MIGINKDYRTVDGGIEIVADDAGEIQPAIDEIAESVSEGNIVGGVVQLKPKAYYPETTIWLKRGVVLRGAREWPQHVNPTAGAYGDVESTGATTLFTSELPEGSAWEIRPEDGGAHTYRHFNDRSATGYYRDNDPDKDGEEQWWHDNSHPHLPVVSAYTKQPIYYNDSLTEDHKRYWGDGVGLMNLRIAADQTRYWGPDDEPDGSQREKAATYYGVYDGFLFEDLEHLHVSNVMVGGFKGYTAFYQDIQRVVSRGNFYKGTATDHHGKALVLSHSNTGLNRYMRGMWDVRVEGPTPTVEVDNHSVDSRFITGAHVKNRIIGNSCEFLGTEADYDAGNAPIVDPDHKHDIVFDKDSYVYWDGYRISDNSSEDKNAYYMADSNTHLHNMQMGTIAGVGGYGITIRDSTVGRIVCRGAQPSVWNTKIHHGIEVESRSDHTGGWHNCVINTGDSGSSIDGYTKQGMHMHDCNIPGGFDNPSSMNDRIVLYNPSGYVNAAAGQTTFSADGSRSFAVPHDMDEIPEHVELSPRNAAARESWPASWSADGGGITFEFDSAPSDDLEISWSAIGWSHPQSNPRLVGEA